eukprot:2095509-Amphidinium_carterae.1
MLKVSRNSSFTFSSRLDGSSSTEDLTASQRAHRVLTALGLVRLEDQEDKSPSRISPQRHHAFWQFFERSEFEADGVYQTEVRQ